MISCEEFITTIEHEKYRLAPASKMPVSSSIKRNMRKSFTIRLKQIWNDGFCYFFTWLMAFTLLFWIVAVVQYDFPFAFLGAGIVFVGGMIITVVIWLGFFLEERFLSGPSKNETDYFEKRRRLWRVFLECLGLHVSESVLNVSTINRSNLLWDNKFQKQMEMVSGTFDEIPMSVFLGAVSSLKKYTEKDLNCFTPEDEVFQGVIMVFHTRTYYAEPIQFSDLDHFNLPEYKGKIPSNQRRYFLMPHTRQKKLSDTFLQKVLNVLGEVGTQTKTSELHAVFYQNKLYVALRPEKLLNCADTKSETLKIFYKQIKCLLEMGAFIQKELTDFEVL